MDKIKKLISLKELIIFITIFFIVGVIVGFGFGEDISENNLYGFTLIKNESNDWYWLENYQYTQTQLNELYTLKNILISNECIDGGFIENAGGKEFLIVCYEGKRVIKEEDKK